MHFNCIFIYENRKLRFQSWWQKFQNENHFFIVVYIMITIMIIEIWNQFFCKLWSKLKLGIKLFNLFDSFLIGCKWLDNFSKLRAQIWKNKRKIWNPKTYDKYSKIELIGICWSNISVTDSCTSDCSPIEWCDIDIVNWQILKSIYWYPTRRVNKI